MPNFFQNIGDVEPCDGRDLLQKLTYVVVSEISKKKVDLCNNLGESFSDFGLENFNPCELFNQTTLNKLVDGDTEGAINYLLATVNLPPHTYKIFNSGFKSLTEAERQDILKYLDRLAIDYARREIEPIILEKVAEILKCPDEQTVIKLRAKLENTARIVNSLQSKVTRLDKYTTPLSVTVSALNQAFKAADQVIFGLDLTLPAVAATPTGASGIIARAISKVERFIDNNKDDVQKLDDNLCNAAKAIRYAKLQLSIVQTLLQLADVFLRHCLMKQGQETPENLLTFTPISFEPSNRQPIQYRGYTLEVRTAASDREIAPRRYAVALDPVGVIVLQGTPSFSSNTEILIEELKFNLDRLIG